MMKEEEENTVDASEEEITDEDTSDFSYKKKVDAEAVKFKKKVLEVLERAKCKSSDFAVSKEFKTPPIVVIDIQGIGKVHFPLYEEEAKTIVERFDQSPFGRKAETLYDVSVRNSKQLEPSFFKIINDDWDSFLKQDVLSAIADELYIKTPFKASLYKLLLYEPGSFFKPHRDTEKEDGMFGTLIIQLPSRYAGGDLHIEHEGKTKHFDFSSIGHSTPNREFKMFFAAFYCDCQHEVLPVTEGYRTCLVYNLVSTQTSEIPAVPKFSELEKLLYDITKSWQEGQPSKIVYALSHKYTESSLSFANLKGTDRSVAAFLKYCSEKCSLELFLGLFERYVQGGATGPEYDYNLICVETDYSLSNCVNASTGEKYTFRNLSVCYGSEVIPSNCFKNVDMDKEEYQEHTGNEGATVERWYNGAALVFWPKGQTVQVLEKADASHEVVTEFFLKTYDSSLVAPEKSSQYDEVLKIYEFMFKTKYALVDSEKVEEVLSTIIALDKLPLLLRFLDRCSFFDEKYVTTLLEQCTKHGWKILGPYIIDMARKRKDGMKLVETLNLMIPEECCSDLDKRETLKECLRIIIKSQEKPSSAPPLWSKACASLINPLRDEKFFFLVYKSALKLDFDMSCYVKVNPVLHAQVLLQMSNDKLVVSHNVWVKAAVECIQSLENMSSLKLQTPAYSRSDTVDCPCKDCEKLGSFLKSTKYTETFKIPKSRRYHLQQKIVYLSDLTYTTECVGSPQTLIVSKTQDSFNSKVLEHEKAATLLPKLKAVLNSGLECNSNSENPSKVIKLEVK